MGNLHLFQSEFLFGNCSAVKVEIGFIHKYCGLPLWTLILDFQSFYWIKKHYEFS